MMHNSSGMAMTQSFNGSIAHVEIRYDKPHAGLSATPGTLLFTGTYDGKRNWYSGVAYVFTSSRRAARPSRTLSLASKAARASRCSAVRQSAIRTRAPSSAMSRRPVTAWITTSACDSCSSSSRRATNMSEY
jgi:hypothetical protein